MASTDGVGDDFLKLEAGRSSGGISLSERLGYHLLNSPRVAVEGLSNSIATILGRPKMVVDPRSQMPGADTAGGMAIDFLAGGLLPMGLELAATGGLGRMAGLAALAKRSPLAGSIAQDALAFGVLGASEDAATGIEQTAEGAAYGYLRALPKMQRILPAIALGKGSEMFYDRNGERPILPGSDISQGDVAGFAGAASAILIGKQLPWKPSAVVGPLPNHFAPVANPMDSGLATGGAMAPDNVFANITRRPDPLPPSDMVVRQALGFDPMARRNDALLGQIRGPLADYPAADAADIFIEQGLPKRTYTPPQPMVEPVLTGKSALRSAQTMDPRVETPQLARQKAKLASLPEFMRTEGGGIDPELLRSIGMPLLRTGVGSVGGAAIAEANDLDPTMGAVAGAALFNLPAAMRTGLGLAQKVFAPIAKQDNMGSVRDPFPSNPRSVESIVPAIKIGDKVVKGMKGDTHKDILNRHMAANPDDVDALMNFDSTANPNFFLDAEGNAISREHLKAVHGIKDSQGLRDMQSKVIDPSPSELTTKWHVTSEDRWKKIDKQGLRPLQDSNWVQAGTKERYGEGKLHAFESFDDAVRWAADADFHQNGKFGSGKMRIIKFADSDKWEVDTNDPLRQHRAKGKWLAKMGGVKRENIQASYVLDDALVQKLRSDLIEPPNHVQINSIRESARLKPLANKEGGFLFPEMQAAMARSTIGALGGGAIGGATGDEPATGFMMGAMIGAAALGGGPSIARAIGEAFGRARTVPTPGAPSVPRSWMGLVKNFSQTVEEASGRALATSAKASARFLRFMDKALDITMPTVAKETLTRARGMASHLLSMMDNALMKVAMRYKPDQVMKDLAMKHLDGTIDAAAFKQQVNKAFPGDVFSEQYANFIVVGRETVNGLQAMVRDGISDPNLRKIINDSIGKYLTRSYKIFTDNAWEPSPQSMDKLVNEMNTLGVLGPNVSPADIRTALEQYVREVKATKGVNAKGFGGAHGEKINQQVLKERKDMSAAWKEFLGEITDPTERLYQTTFRLRPMAEAARYIDQLAFVKEDGWLPHRFASYAEKDAFEARLLHDVQNAPNAQDAVIAQSKLDKFKLKWTGGQNVEKHPKFGTLQGHIVSRNVWDTLSTYDSFTDPTSSPLLRSIAGAHTMIKLGRTAFNPITVMRNFITMPMFAIIAKAHPQDWSEAWKIMRDPSHPMFKEIMENGISNVDQVKTEFFKEFENVTGGKYNFGHLDLSTLGLGKFDLDMAEKMGRRGIRNWLDVYRLPDNMVRIGSYLSAKRRFAQDLGLPESHADVIGKATTFVNRYTMNYDTVAPAVKVARQVPFVNLFITYTAEMTRILKNLGQDLISGSKDGLTHDRMYAALPLGMLAVLPELWQSASESNLSPKDKVDWEKAKGLMPAYARTRYRVGIHRNAQGQFEYTDITPLIASDSLNQSVKALVTGDMKALASVNPIVGIENTPALNVVAAQIAGKDLHTHREFRGTADRIATVAKEVLPPWFPGVGSEAIRFRQAHAQTASGDQGLTNQRTGNRLTPQDFWQPYYSGIKTGSMNLDVLQQRAVSEAKRNIANEVAYLNDVLKTDSTDEVKQNALEKAKISIAEIQENLRQHVETQ